MESVFSNTDITRAISTTLWTYSHKKKKKHKLIQFHTPRVIVHNHDYLVISLPVRDCILPSLPSSPASRSYIANKQLWVIIHGRSSPFSTHTHSPNHKKKWINKSKVKVAVRERKQQQQQKLRDTFTFDYLYIAPTRHAPDTRI